MTTATDFDFLNARLHGLRSRLFEGDRLEALLRAQTLPELAQAMIGEPLLAQVGALERRLVSDHVAALARLSRHMAGAVRACFRALLGRYRTENLKVVVRWRADPEPRTSPAPLLVPLPDWLEMPYEPLIAAPDVPALVAALPDPQLARAARRGLAAFERLYLAEVIPVGRIERSVCKMLGVFVAAEQDFEDVGAGNPPFRLYLRV